MAYKRLRTDYGKCDTLPFTNGTGSELAAGTLHIVGQKLGIVYDDTPDSEGGVLIVGIPAPGAMLPKATGNAFAEGDPVYWSTANSNLDSTDTNALVGHTYKPADASATEVQVVLTNEQEVA